VKGLDLNSERSEESEGLAAAKPLRCDANWRSNSTATLKGREGEAFSGPEASG
jgi:hypothetical protein